MNIVALIQARMNSTRLPCKAMLHLHGQPIIDWVVHRTSKSHHIDQITVATSINALDDILATHLEAQGVDVFRGPEEDVLERFCLAAQRARATHVVRICADNPLVWGAEIDNLINHFLKLPDTGATYAYNHIPRNNNYPDGVGAEMVSYALLLKLNELAVEKKHREHCLSYIWDHPEDFVISTFDPPDPRMFHPEFRLDVDTPQDFRKLALMPIHANMPPPEILLRYPRTTAFSVQKKSKAAPLPSKRA